MHRNGATDVELAPPTDGSAAGKLRARNLPSAAWNPATGTCRDVYCHSGGQDVPTYVETPPWTAAPGALGCDGCHGNPPRYASSGPDLAAPNSHLQLAPDGWEWGHYVGLPGPWHGTLPGSTVGHGVDGAASAPITCQTCHFDTVDPANTAPGGFHYLDTSGDYALPGGDAARADDPLWKRTQCATCHDGVSAPAGRGKVLPLRHVNGRRDVAFDPRVALPAGYATGLPASVATEPLAPYYVSPFNVTVAGWTLPAGAEVRAGPDGSSALDFTLASAAYDPATRTCSNVACHLARQSGVDAGQAPPLRWGMPYVSSFSCDYCHGMSY
jgi:predicted CxxxxCH...CXXCH cytochrome family protein